MQLHTVGLRCISHTKTLTQHQTNKYNGKRHPQHDINQVDTVIMVIPVWSLWNPEKMRKDEQTEIDGEQVETKTESEMKD